MFWDFLKLKIIFLHFFTNPKANWTFGQNISKHYLNLGWLYIVCIIVNKFIWYLNFTSFFSQRTNYVFSLIQKYKNWLKKIINKKVICISFSYSKIGRPSHYKTPLICQELIIN